MIDLFLFKSFLINSFLSGMLGSVFLVIRRAMIKKLSCMVTYYISFFIILSAIFPFGVLMSKPIKSVVSDTHIPAITFIVENDTSQKHWEINNNYFCFVFYIWLVISLLLLCSIVIRYMKLVRDINRWKEPSDFKSSEIGGIPVYSCKIVSTPMLIGLIKRELIIPETLIDSYSYSLICKHEIVHHKRHDIIIKTVIMIVCTLNWFNPLIWMLARNNADDCEASCDLIAKRTMQENDKKYYCKLLLSIANQSSIFLPVSSFSNNYKSVSRRIDVILNKKCDKKSTSVYLLFLMSVLLAGSMIISAYYTPVFPSQTVNDINDGEIKSNITINGQAIKQMKTSSDDNEITYEVSDKKSNSDVEYIIVTDAYQSIEPSLDIVTEK